MGILGSVYIALAIFGLGVTVVDLFGALGHHDSGGHHGDGHDAAHDADGHAADDQAADGHDAGGHDFGDHAAGGHDLGGHDSGGHDSSHADHVAGDHGAHHGDAADHHSALERSSLLGTVDAKARIVGRLVMALRIAVSFSVGAGLTGFVATVSGIGPLPGMLWSAAGPSPSRISSPSVRLTSGCSPSRSAWKG